MSIKINLRPTKNPISPESLKIMEDRAKRVRNRVQMNAVQPLKPSSK